MISLILIYHIFFCKGQYLLVPECSKVGTVLFGTMSFLSFSGVVRLNDLRVFLFTFIFDGLCCCCWGGSRWWSDHDLDHLDNNDAAAAEGHVDDVVDDQIVTMIILIMMMLVFDRIWSGWGIYYEEKTASSTYLSPPPLTALVFFLKPVPFFTQRTQNCGHFVENLRTFDVLLQG